MKRSCLKVSVVMILAGLAGFVAVQRSQAQEPSANVAGTVWMGGENLNGKLGPLGFVFAQGGTVLMCDRSSNPKELRTYVRGTWTQNGGEIEIRFGNCVYRGRMEGGVLAGTAQSATQTWAFAVKYEPPQNGAGNGR